ncbi:MAG: SRPBCC domain-containing protein [Devosia sp.]
MTDTELRSVVVERDIAYPAEKIWRALTQPHLMGEWLMKNDFKPVVGQSFKFTEDWGGIECKVLTLEPNRTLSYSWSAFGLDSVVTWTLVPTPAGTRLRMEQAGFPLDQEQAYRGAQQAWPGFLDKLQQLLAEDDD